MGSSQVDPPYRFGNSIAAASRCRRSPDWRTDPGWLEIRDPAWQPPTVDAVRFGRFTGRSPQVPCEATGFPRVQRDPDGTRESEQISGTTNSGTGASSSYLSPLFRSRDTSQA